MNNSVDTTVCSHACDTVMVFEAEKYQVLDSILCINWYLCIASNKALLSQSTNSCYSCSL